MRVLGFILLMGILCPASHALWDTQSDTWSATDAIGRSLPLFEEVGAPRENKFVGLFYFLWMGQHGTQGPYDINKILAADPTAITNTNHPLWGPLHTFHHWGESIFGYYLSTDPYVYRKHAQMLSDAMVDVIIFDVTNKSTYPDSYRTLCAEFQKLRDLGWKTPDILFLTPFWDPESTVETLYQDLYKPGSYSNLWFRWEGKPLILADPARISSSEIKTFFSFRKPMPDYQQGPTGLNQWPWLEIYPQHVFASSNDSKECMAVGVAQNAVRVSENQFRAPTAFTEPNTLGRSFYRGTPPAGDGLQEGFNFQQQWDRALEIDPKFLFVTGWNEWIAVRFVEFAGVSAPVVFVDQFNTEYSRDCEPSLSPIGDNYYYQMIANIRRFKGVRPLPTASQPQPIQIDGDFRDWSQVQPEYRDNIGDKVSRDWPGYANAGRYVNKTGRNDFILAKVTQDNKNLYFYMHTREFITNYQDPNWMLLFLNTDGDSRNGFAGYDFLINRSVIDANSSRVEKAGGGWFTGQEGTASYRVVGNQLELAVPRSAVGLEGLQDKRMIHFKWADNIQKEGEVMEFTISGDAAPNDRYNYRYEVLPAGEISQLMLK